MEEIARFIARHRIAFTFAPVPIRPKSARGTFGSEALHFAYHLFNPKGRLSGFYTCGIGHLPGYPKSGNPRGWSRGEQAKRERIRFRPTDSDVLWSLLMDASVDPELSFREWCADYCVTDAEMSPADALETYTALRDTRSALQKILGREFEAAVEIAREL